MIRTLLIAAILSVSAPLFAFNYPPEMEGAETVAYKTIGDVTMNLYVFKPQGWKAEDSRPNLMLLFNPTCVLAPFDGKQPWPEDRAEEFLEKMGIDPVEISPVHHVTSETPPGIIFHGTADDAVPFSTSEQFAKAVKAANVRCDLKAYKDQPHGFFNYGRNENVEFYATLNAMDAFLVDVGWLPENPN